MSLKKKINLCREFGFKVLFSDLCAKNIRIPKITSRWKDKIILQWLRKNFPHVLEQYKNISSQHRIISDTSASTVWSMWLDGEENAPEIVRLCFSCIRKNCGNHPFKIITRENLREYISLPGYIYDRLRSGGMKTAHFSDVVRMSLLSEYGGLWLDSTIFTASKIPEEIFASDYYTVRHSLNKSDRNVAMQRWTTYLQAARKDNILCRFVLDMMLEYWKMHETFIDYVMMDYFFALAYEDLPECRKILDSVPVSNNSIEDMRPLLGSKYDAEIYDELTRETKFFKLTYKQKFPKNIAGHETFYGHIMQK